MPTWVTWVVAAAAFVTAVGVLISKVVRPGIRAASTAEEMLPLLRDLTVEFKGTPHAFTILKEIIAQFRTDSGSTLRDVVNRLEAAAIEAKAITEQLRIDAQADRQLDERDRQDIRKFLLVLDRLTVQVEALTQSGHRIESDRAAVARDLQDRIDVVDRATAGVAADLAASHERADAVAIGDHGQAADAASRSAEAEAIAVETKNEQ